MLTTTVETYEVLSQAEHEKLAFAVYDSRYLIHTVPNGDRIGHMAIVIVRCLTQQPSGVEDTEIGYYFDDEGDVVDIRTECGGD